MNATAITEPPDKAAQLVEAFGRGQDDSRMRALKELLSKTPQNSGTQ